MTQGLRRFIQGSCVLLFCAAANAQESPWNFQYSVIDSELSVIIMPPGGPLPGENTDITFSTPDKTSTGYGSPGSGSSAGEYLYNYGAVQATAAQAWSLSAVRNGVTSTYNFSADLSGISASSIPQVTSVNLPAYGMPFPTQQPTFRWTETGDFTENFLDILSLTSNLRYHADLPADQTSWTVPAALPPGNYAFSLQLPMTPTTVPLSSTLLSGPDLDLPNTANFGAEAWYQASFSIVPEPTTITLATGVTLAALARRRRKA